MKIGEVSLYDGIGRARALTIFSRKGFSVPYVDGVKPADYEVAWHKMGTWVLDQGIISPDFGRSLSFLLETADQVLTPEQWASLSEEDHITYPVVLLNDRLDFGQRGKVGDWINNQRNDYNIAQAIRNAQSEWAGTAILNYHQNEGVAFDFTKANELHDEMCSKARSYVGLHFVALDRLPQYADASRKYHAAQVLLRDARAKAVHPSWH